MQCAELLVGYFPGSKKRKALKDKFCKEGFNALNYKMRISASERDTSVTLKNMNYPLVLSTMGKEAKHIDLCFVKEDKNNGGKRIVELGIVISICVREEDRTVVLGEKEKALRNLIESSIVEFFALHNFGQRSDKGFGSFTVADIDGVPQGIITKYVKDAPNFKFDLRDGTPTHERFLKLFSVIDFYWKVLKSGVNYTDKVNRNGRVERINKDRYIKSVLYRYLKDNTQYTWEKKEIKKHFDLACKVPDGELKVQDDKNGGKPIFARALLGYPSVGFVYRSIGDNNMGKASVSVNSGKSGIARIAAPIIFKPVFGSDGKSKEVVVYILFDDELIKALHAKENIRFVFKRTEPKYAPLWMPTDMAAVDYRKLIDYYHDLYSDGKYSMIPVNKKGSPILNGSGKIFLSKPVKRTNK